MIEVRTQRPLFRASFHKHWCTYSHGNFSHLLFLIRGHDGEYLLITLINLLVTGIWTRVSTVWAQHSTSKLSYCLISLACSHMSGSWSTLHSIVNFWFWAKITMRYDTHSRSSPWPGLEPFFRVGNPAVPHWMIDKVMATHCELQSGPQSQTVWTHELFPRLIITLSRHKTNAKLLVSNH